MKQVKIMFCHTHTTPNLIAIGSVVDRKALFQYELNDTGDGGRWYFYLDDHWKDALSETDCQQKQAKARFSGIII